MIVALLLTVTLGAGPQAAPSPQPDPKFIRVYVQTDDGGDASELAARQESVRHLKAVFGERKKAAIAVVVTEDDADVIVEVEQRSVTVPKVVIGLSGGMGSPGSRPGAPTAPVRVVKLQVTVAMAKDADPVELANKNRANENENGWKSAAEDVAKQVEMWIGERRAAIIAARGR